MKTVHVITRLILGGAQENTLLTVEDQHHDWHDPVTLITGPGLGPEGSLIQRAESQNLDLRVIPEFRREIHPLRDWWSYRRLLGLLREIQPDIVHTHSSKAGILGRAAAYRLKIPCVHTIHGPSFYAGQSKVTYALYRALETWAARRCDRLISVCDAMTDQYVAAKVAPRSKFVTVYSGMEVDRFLNPGRSRAEVRQELGIHNDEIVIGKVARLFHLKGHDDVIAAAEQAIRVNPRLKFLFVGDGLLRSELEHRISELGLTDRFIFTGLVPPEAVPELIHAMDIVVHTSLREGLARVLPQGFIAGKPVISYDVDGAREVVLPERTGYLLQPRDISSLVIAILNLANDPEKRQQYGQAGRELFTERFRHEFMTCKLREIYAEVIAERARS